MTITNTAHFDPFQSHLRVVNRLHRCRPLYQPTFPPLPFPRPRLMVFWLTSVTIVFLPYEMVGVGGVGKG